MQKKAICYRGAYAMIRRHRGIAKTMLVMKLTVFFFIVGLLSVQGKGISQTITLEGKDMPLTTVFAEIKKQTGYSVLANYELLKTTKPVTISVKDVPVGKFLELVLKDQPIKYSIVNKTISINKKSGRTQTPAFEEEELAPPINGRVTDSTGKPLEGISIVVKGTNRGTTTDETGRYALNVENRDVLIFSMTGFESHEATVNGRTSINVVLKQQNTMMDQLVVIGYGTVNKRDVTGSVGQVKMEEMQKAPVVSFEEALAGRVAGVKVSSADGQPGADINVVIRGTNSVTQDNSPLYIVDGFPMENPDNYAINPAEIESIEVLKDASSTAIYGARGANGVVLITTKKGKVGEPVINYNTYYGFLENKRKMELMDPYEFVKYQMERDSANAADTYLTNGKTLEDFRNVQGADLQDRIFRKSPFQNHFLSISGGKGGTRYSLSGSILHQDGVIKNSGYDRYQGRMNIDQTVNSTLKIGINANYTVTNRFGTVPSEQNTGFFYGNLMYSVWAYRPASGNVQVDPVDNPDDDFLNLMGFDPVKTVENELRENRNNLLTVNAYAEQSIGKYLKLRVTGGLTSTKGRADRFNNSQTRLGSPLTTAGQNNGVNGSVNFNELTSFLNENTLNFQKTFNSDHKIDAVAGFTTQKTTTSTYGAAANHIPNESLGIAGIDEGEPVSINSTSSLYTLASFLGRINYSYRSKYLITASMRADGSSKFSDDNKWGYFPSGAVAWRIDRENFMKSIGAISEAKLRASYGITGNNRVPDFAYLSRIDLPSSLGYSYENLPVVAAVLSELGNVNLKWESTKQLNIGLDLGFFNQRVLFTADVYRKTTSDLLLNARLPISMGFTEAVKNIGKVQNEGLEITLNTTNVKSSDFTWNSNFNISFNRNKVLALAENQTELFSLANWNIDVRSVPPYIAEVGFPVARFWGYVWEGNYQYEDFDKTADGFVLKEGIATYGSNRALTQPGDIRYKDMNGDGKVNTEDRTVIGNPNPRFTGGFSNDFTYKNFDLNVFLEFSQGNDVLNANRIIFEGGGRVNQNMYATYLNRWTPENQNDLYYRTNGRGPADFGYSTRVIEDGSYLRLKTVSLGYNISPKVLRKIKLSTCRLYVSAQNLYTWTKYTGFDPEVSAYGNSALMPGFDYSVYPRSRTITFGANISF